jgi:large subunit ribosomal protein L35
MPKQKTRKSVSKRFRVSKGGKVLRTTASRRHMATGKTRKRKRQLRGATLASPADSLNMKKMVPYG